MILVVTDTHEPAAARDVLERILTSDRADIPATKQRRELAATVPQARAVPVAAMSDPELVRHHRTRRPNHPRRRPTSPRQRTTTRRATRPDRRRRTVPNCNASNRCARHTTPSSRPPIAPIRRTARRAASCPQDARRTPDGSDVATPEHTSTTPDPTHRGRATSRTHDNRTPHHSSTPGGDAHVQIDRGTGRQSTNRILDRWDDPRGNLERAHETSPQRSTSGRTGRTVTPSTPDQLSHAVAVLNDSNKPGHRELAAPLTEWVRRHHPELVREPVIERPGIDLGIGL